jgi:gas vesicle protein
MDNRNEEYTKYGHYTLGFLGGMLVGGLAGAGTMLLLAPQSGKKTRAQIQKKGVELRNQTNDAVADARTQVQRKGRQIRTSVHDQAEALQQRGQDVFDEQKERLSNLVDAGKTAVQDAMPG